MKVYSFVLIALTVFISGCTHTRHFSTTEFDGVNKITERKKATIKLANGNVIFGRDIQISQDSTFWLESKTGHKRSIPTLEVSQIVLLRRGRGALHGFGFGFLIGGLLGTQDSQTELGTIDASAATVLVDGAIMGLFVGLPIGALVGSREKLVINKTKE